MYGQKHIPQTFYMCNMKSWEYSWKQWYPNVFLSKIAIFFRKWRCFEILFLFMIHVFYYFTVFDLLSSFMFLLLHYTVYISNYLRKEYLDKNLEQNLFLKMWHISHMDWAIGTETEDLWMKSGIRMYNNIISSF